MLRLNILILFIMFLLIGCGHAKTLPTSLNPTPDQLSARVYVLHGSHKLPNPINKGFINNPGLVITDDGVVIIDPGSSQAVGNMVLAKIREITQKPVVAIFNTHIHGDHWLANTAVKKVFPNAVIYGHGSMKSLADSGEGDNWIRLFNRLTDGATTGTEATAPDIAVSDGDIFEIGGLHFRIYHTGRAHTDGDIMIGVVEEKVMFLGDICMNQRIGVMVDGNFKGNVAALNLALKTNAKVFVPGHGLSGGPEKAVSYRDYLDGVYQVVAKLYEQGIPDYEMKATAAQKLSKFKRWEEFDSQLGQHISLCYLQVEQEAF